MKRTKRVGETGGFAVVDEKGRFALPKPIRQELGIDAGASVAWLVVDGAVVVVPQDGHLAELFARGQRALAAAGLSVEQIEASLPEARAQAVEELYGRDLVEELASAEASLPTSTRAS